MKRLVLALVVLVGGVAIVPPESVEASPRRPSVRRRFEGPRERAQRLQRERAQRDLLRALQQLRGGRHHHGR